MQCTKASLTLLHVLPKCRCKCPCQNRVIRKRGIQGRSPHRLPLMNYSVCCGRSGSEDKSVREKGYFCIKLLRALKGENREQESPHWGPVITLYLCIPHTVDAVALQHAYKKSLVFKNERCWASNGKQSHFRLDDLCCSIFTGWYILWDRTYLIFFIMIPGTKK